MLRKSKISLTCKKNVSPEMDPGKLVKKKKRKKKKEKEKSDMTYLKIETIRIAKKKFVIT